MHCFLPQRTVLISYLPVYHDDSLDPTINQIGEQPQPNDSNNNYSNGKTTTYTMLTTTTATTNNAANNSWWQPLATIDDRVRTTTTLSVALPLWLMHLTFGLSTVLQVCTSNCLHWLLRLVQLIYPHNWPLQRCCIWAKVSGLRE